MDDPNANIEEPYLKQSYYLRLHLLITNLGTLVLRKKVDQSFPPSTLAADLSKNSIKIKKIDPVKKYITSDQYEKLYPPKGKPPPSSEKFDITLLVFLLRHVCGLNDRATCWDPKKPPSSGVSEEADIARIRNIRNEISHEPIAVLEYDDFKSHWAKVELILLRLASKIPDLHDMKARIDELASINLDVLSAELKSLKSKASLFFHEFGVGEAYVKTSSYVNAKQVLEEKNVVVLTGLPGEGKSTMAGRLALDLSDTDRCLNLCTPTDWTHVDLKLGIFDTVIIDDIFGARAFDRTLAEEWKRYLPDIQRAASSKKMKFVITSRQYIMEEIRQTLGSIPLFEDGNMFHLSSKDLSEEEKISMLSNKLDKYDRLMTVDQIAECKTQSSSFFGRSVNVDSDFQFGFPECADMFAKNDALYNRGAEFFQTPNAFFKKCLQNLYHSEENEKKFLALITVWANDGRLSVNDLDLKERPSENVQNIVKSFGFKLKPNLVKLLRKSLEYHRRGFLSFNETIGEYSFSHNIIGDMVGLVVSEDYLNATIEFCTREFLMQYVTIDKSLTPDYKVVVKQYQYPLLGEKIVKLLLRKDCNNYQNKTDYNFSQIERSGVRPNRVEPKYELDIGIILHPVFKSGPFVKTFLDCVAKHKDDEDIFTKPVMSMSGFFYDYGIKMEKLDMCLAAYSVFIGADTFAMEVIEREILDKDNSDRTFSLLLAVHASNIKLVRLLLIHGATVTGDVIYIAANQNNTELLSVLLDHPGTNVNDRGNAINGNYPLIVAARKGLMAAVRCLLEHGADLSVQNTAKMTALHKSIVYTHHEISKLLIKEGAPLDVKGGKFMRTPLHVACDMGEKNVVKQILQKGTSVHVKDHRGHYAIHCAAIRGYVRIVTLLLKHDKSQEKLKITSYGKKSILKGMTVYHVAVWKKNQTLLDALIKMNIDPNTGDCFGQTPLFYAIMNGEESIAKKLLRTSDIKKPQKQGYTPLHAAIHKGQTKLAELICPHVNVNAKDKFGKTPLHVACEKGNVQIAKKLTSTFGVEIRALTKRKDTVFHILQRKINAKVSSNVLRVNCIKIAKTFLNIDPTLQDWLKNARNKNGVIVNEKSLLAPEKKYRYATSSSDDDDNDDDADDEDDTDDEDDDNKDDHEDDCDIHDSDMDDDNDNDTNDEDDDNDDDHDDDGDSHDSDMDDDNDDDDDDDDDDEDSDDSPDILQDDNDNDTNDEDDDNDDDHEDDGDIHDSDMDDDNDDDDDDDDDEDGDDSSDIYDEDMG